MESSLRLDPHTLVFSVAILGYLMALVSFCLARALPRHGFVEWGAAMGCGATGLLLYFFRGNAPLLLTYVVANVLVTAYVALTLFACSRLLEVAPPQQVISLTIALGIGGVTAVYFFAAPRNLAVFSMSAAIAVGFGAAALMVFRSARKRRSSVVWAASATMGMMALIFAIRAMMAVFGEGEAVSSPTVDTSAQIGVLIFGALLATLSTITFIAMANERRRRETQDRVRHDGLTGLYTRSAFTEMMTECSLRGLGQGYAVVMLDIDHFKSVNDTYGHRGGDIVLAHAGRLISQSVRLTDFAVRYGGEEFCVLLNGCAEKEAAQFAQRLVADACQQSVRLQDGRNIAFTMSAGYAYTAAESAGSPRAESLEDVIERADRALYRAKTGGRNQAVSANVMDLLCAAPA